eukprot:749722-Hanusia_phi.AAC.6
METSKVFQTSPLQPPAISACNSALGLTIVRHRIMFDLLFSFSSKPVLSELQEAPLTVGGSLAPQVLAATSPRVPHSIAGLRTLR